jgi:3-phosphoshikimate 1-carboxyvinyltransferase
MDREIAPFSYNGTLYINSSKSYFQRALAISCLTNSSCLITGFPKEDDIKVALGICSDIGLGIVVKNDSVKVIGDIPDRLESISINSGESGLSTRMFGIKVINDDYLKFSIVGNQISKTRKYNVEGDWSSAAFHFVGAAISGSVKIYGLKITSLQADRAIIDVLKSCGAKVVLNDDFIIINRNRLNAFVFDANNCPDLFPALVVLAACCDGRSIISGVERLSNKESNRALTLKLEFKKLGVQISIDGNKMFIDGGHKISGGHVKSHGDHRIAMALSVITSVSESSIIINDSEVISKSYSNFYSDLLFVSS